jgi:hypothetical protein
VIDQLVLDGATRLHAQVAAAAVFAALTSALLHWSVSGEGSLSDLLAEALGVLEARHE